MMDSASADLSKQIRRMQGFADDNYSVIESLNLE